MTGADNFVMATLSNGGATGARISGDLRAFNYPSDGSGFATTPVVNNGNLYLTGLDDNLLVFSVPGNPVY
jgi:hypothetical protein